jgi:shikimate kinase
MNVYLIGSRGVGKSTVAPLAADLLDMAWLDLDREIERRTGKSVSSIFGEDGEAAFRELESAELMRVVDQDLLVATGGGVVLRDENRRILKSGICVWVRAELATLLARLQSSPSRPPLTGMTIEDETKSMLDLRSPTYRELADVIVDADFLGPNELAKAVAIHVRSQLDTSAEEKKGGGGSK